MARSTLSSAPDVKPTRNHAASDVRIPNFLVGNRAATKRRGKNVEERNLHPRISFHVWYETKGTGTPLELLRTIIIMSEESGVIFCSICYEPRVVTEKGWNAANSPINLSRVPEKALPLFRFKFPYSNLNTILITFSGAFKWERKQKYSR